MLVAPKPLEKLVAVSVPSRILTCSRRWRRRNWYCGCKVATLFSLGHSHPLIDILVTVRNAEGAESGWSPPSEGRLLRPTRTACPGRHSPCFLSSYRPSSHRCGARVFVSCSAGFVQTFGWSDNDQYNGGSPGGRVFQRRCTHSHCSGYLRA